MTADEARELIIGGIDYAAYKETESSLYDSDKNRLYGSDHYQSGRFIVKPSPWAEGDFEKKMAELLRIASRLNLSDPKFAEAQQLLRGEDSVLGEVIRLSKGEPRGIRDLALFWLAAMATFILWIAQTALSIKSAALEWAAHMAYPASIILLAGSLALTVLRVRWLKNDRGSISLRRSGLIVVLVLAAIFVIYSRGGDVIHNVCFLAASSIVLAYAFLVILRGNDTVW